MVGRGWWGVGGDGVEFLTRIEKENEEESGQCPPLAAWTHPPCLGHPWLSMGPTILGSTLGPGVWLIHF